ncbi:AraC family transcriptional regulator [Tateyamaria sp. syn59]|uniref:helix-turn-helix domain-containing protein n=1 Tax=Tateyamaria sp. syn59 TaxID=2576942 RepID=UPI0011BEE96B|nr:helix-turn-helix domain-containing protein [Tateyamaria sp. syn59]
MAQNQAEMALLYARSYGPWCPGCLAFSQPTLGGLFDSFCRKSVYQMQGAWLKLNVSGDFANITYYHAPDDDHPRICFDETFIVAASAEMLLRHAPDCTVNSAQLATNQVAGKALSAQIKTPVEANAAESAISFDAAVLQQQVPQAVPKLSSSLQLGTDVLMPDGTTCDLLSRLKTAVAASITDGTAQTIERYAHDLGITTRTLQRHVADHGTTISAIRDTLREERACRLLTDTDMPIKQISSVLGYASQTTFFRVFRQWKGTSPAAYRKTSQAKSSDGRK